MYIYTYNYNILVMIISISLDKCNTWFALKKRAPKKRVPRQRPSSHARTLRDGALIVYHIIL